MSDSLSCLRRIVILKMPMNLFSSFRLRPLENRYSFRRSAVVEGAAHVQRALYDWVFLLLLAFRVSMVDRCRFAFRSFPIRDDGSTLRGKEK